MSWPFITDKNNDHPFIWESFPLDPCKARLSFSLAMHGDAITPMFELRKTRLREGQ